MFDGKILQLWTSKYFQKSKIKGISHFRNKIGSKVVILYQKKLLKTHKSENVENVTKNKIFTYCAFL